VEFNFKSFSVYNKISDLMAEKIPVFGQAVKWYRGRKEKQKEKFEDTKTGATKSLLLYSAFDGITKVEENLYERLKESLEADQKKEKDEGSTINLNPIREARKRLGLPLDIDIMFPTDDPEHPFFIIPANSLEEAKEKIRYNQANLEKGYGIKIKLEELEVKERSK
jgi:hypothetical protein